MRYLRNMLWVAGVIAVVTAVVTPAGARGTESITAARISAGGLTRVKTPVLTRMIVKGKSADVHIIGYSEDKVFVRPVSERGKVSGEVLLSDIAVTLFELKVDKVALVRAERSRKWGESISLFSPDFERVKDLLHMPDNNALEPCYKMGTQMMSAASRLERKARTQKDIELVAKRYKAAYDVYVKCSKAIWSSRGLQSQLKGCKCLLAMGKPKTCRYYLDRIDEPMPGDAAYGLYWLVQGEVDAKDGDFRTALDASVLSVAFENKDIETFPDALMLSARCYEELREWHRARDVYFEVASIFPNTDWADDAAGRLTFILDEGLTEKKEDSPIENVFFGLDEDINELARELLQRRSEQGMEPESGSTEDGTPEE